jgi:hypothetical protein
MHYPSTRALNGIEDCEGADLPVSSLSLLIVFESLMRYGKVPAWAFFRCGELGCPPPTSGLFGDELAPFRSVG